MTTGLGTGAAKVKVDPAGRLLGEELPGGWVVVREAPHKPATGGCFSVGYIVENRDGRVGFLKAMDYSRAFKSGPLKTLSVRLESVTQAINHERKLLERCGDRKLKRVVRAIGFGQFRHNGADDLDVVEFLIFELADTDIRHQMTAVSSVTLAWKFKVLHHIAVGLRQLHEIDIAHQDLKPSNVLVFADEIMKVADLGRAQCKGLVSPHEDFPIAGDPTYAAPEAIYGYVPSDWNSRRFGLDAYHLGSMVTYLFCGHSMTELLLGYVHDDFDPDNWEGTYDEALPLLLETFGRILEDFSTEVPAPVRESVVAVVEQLCHPDIRKRGHPSARRGRGNPLSLERYVTRFDALHKKALLAAG
jgi:serine/threonine protein kinase